jgi:hypothetical protein
MPEEVRITATSVGEKSKLEVAFADINLASARLDSASDSPRSIIMGLGGCIERRVEKERSARFGKTTHRRLLN